MNNETRCAGCGTANPVDSRFCSECGAKLEAERPAPADPANKKGGGALPWVLGGCFFGIGLAVLAVVGLFLLFVMRAPDPVSTPTTVVVTPPPATPPLGTTPPRTPPTPPPVPTGPETEKPEAWPYASARSDCSQHVMISDAFKEVAIGIDQQMRTMEPVSTAEEAAIGAEYVEQLPEVLGGRLVKTGPLPAYLAGVARPMLAHVERKDVTFHFYMLEDTDMENALALPGGYIVVTRPLFDAWATNEARLATVLGHEMAHVDNRHPIAVVQYARALGLPDDDEVAQGLVYLAQMPYSSSLEEESDREGAIYLHRAGYSIFQAVALWRSQASSDGGAAPIPDPAEADDPLAALLGVAVGELEHLMSTHPNAARRACLLEQQAYDLFQSEPKESVYIGTRNLRERVPMADRAY